MLRFGEISSRLPCGFQGFVGAFAGLVGANRGICFAAGSRALTIFAILRDCRKGKRLDVSVGHCLELVLIQEVETVKLVAREQVLVREVTTGREQTGEVLAIRTEREGGIRRDLAVDWCNSDSAKTCKRTSAIWRRRRLSLSATGSSHPNSTRGSPDDDLHSADPFTQPSPCRVPYDLSSDSAVNGCRSCL